MHQKKGARHSYQGGATAKDLLSRLAIGMYLVVQVVALTSVYVVNVDNNVIITVFFPIIIIITILAFVAVVVTIIMSKIQRKQRPTEISDDYATIVPSIDVPLSQDVQLIPNALRGPY